MIKTGNKKIWLLVIITIAIVVQVTVISEFHSISEYGYASNYSVVDIVKLNYVYARLIVSITPSNNQTTIIFPNGTQTTLSRFQTVSYTIVMPRNADIFGNAAAAVNGLSVSETQPIAADVLSNYTSSFGFEQVPITNIPFVNEYYLIVKGYADVSIQGYGIAI